jgi:hypothetical protein
MTTDIPFGHHGDLGRGLLRDDVIIQPNCPPMQRIVTPDNSEVTAAIRKGQ